MSSKDIPDSRRFPGYGKNYNDDEGPVLFTFYADNIAFDPTVINGSRLVGSVVKLINYNTVTLAGGEDIAIGVLCQVFCSGKDEKPTCTVDTGHTEQRGMHINSLEKQQKLDEKQERLAMEHLRSLWEKSGMTDPRQAHAADPRETKPL